MSHEKYHAEREIRSFLGVRWGAGREDGKKCKRLAGFQNAQRESGTPGPWKPVFLSMLRF